jgi:hypothetical protein
MAVLYFLHSSTKSYEKVRIKVAYYAGMDFGLDFYEIKALKNNPEF